MEAKYVHVVRKNKVCDSCGDAMEYETSYEFSVTDWTSAYLGAEIADHICNNYDDFLEELQEQPGLDYPIKITDKKTREDTVDLFLKLAKKHQCSCACYKEKLKSKISDRGIQS